MEARGCVGRAETYVEADRVLSHGPESARDRTGDWKGSCSPVADAELSTSGSRRGQPLLWDRTHFVKLREAAPSRSPCRAVCLAL